MSKYEIKFCSCGRIHVIPYNESWNWIQEDYKNRSVLFTCTHCGVSSKMWLNEYEDGYACNQSDVKDEIFTDNNMKVILNSGIRVYMKSGEEADYRVCEYFVNTSEWKNEENKRGYVPVDESAKNGEKWALVDTERLIRDIRSEYREAADDILKAISGYVTNIRWKGTKYETKWNK